MGKRNATLLLSYKYIFQRLSVSNPGALNQSLKACDGKTATDTS
jgi:hypothetical protein